MADPITIGPTQDVLCQLHPIDAAGNPVAASVAWGVSDPSIITLEVAPDTLSARAVSLRPGTSTVQASAGAVLEQGDITVAVAPPPPPAASLGLTFTAVDKSPQ